MFFAGLFFRLQSLFGAIEDWNNISNALYVKLRKLRSIFGNGREATTHSLVFPGMRLTMCLELWLSVGVV